MIFLILDRILGGIFGGILCRIPGGIADGIFGGILGRIPGGILGGIFGGILSGIPAPHEVIFEFYHTLLAISIN